MKLHYQQAVVSLCLDLTNPEGVSRPVAVLLVGKADECPVAAVAGHEIRDEDYDPITREVLQDIPQLVKRHLNRAFTPDADLEQVLHVLDRSLRNSLHVSRILPERTIDVRGDSFEQAAPEITKLVTDTLTSVDPTIEPTPVRKDEEGIFGRPRPKGPPAGVRIPAQRSAVAVWNPPCVAAM